MMVGLGISVYIGITTLCICKHILMVLLQVSNCDFGWFEFF